MDRLEEARALPAFRSVPDLIAFAILRVVATLTAFHGLSMLVSALPLLKYASKDPRIDAASDAALWLAVVFLVTGSLARHLSRSPRPLLPNERTARAAQPMPLGGWLLVMAGGLWLLPLSTFYGLGPLASLSADMIKVLQENHVVDNALSSPQMSGLVLAPVAAAVIVPLLQLVTAAAFVGSSIVLSMLLLARSFRFPRAYLICVLLQAGLVFASVYGAELANGVAAWVAAEAGRSTTQLRTIEVVRILEAVARYNGVLRSTSHSLAWTFVGYAVWVAPLLTSGRARDTFAVNATAFAPDMPPPLQAAGDLAPDARRRFYEDAARTLQAPTTGVRAFRANTFTVVIVSALVGALFILLAVLRVVNEAGASRPLG